jgi:hypothetical protein
MAETKYPVIFGALAAPFEPEEIKERSQGGRTLSYITPRTARNRLDEVVGPENWKPFYRETAKGVVCTISIRLPSGEWIDKEDVGGFPGMTEKGGEIDEENDVKAGYSDSFKRAAECWGIGRYLWRDGVPPCFRGSFGPGEGGEPAVRHDPGQRSPDRQPSRGGAGSGGGERPAFPATDRMPPHGRALFAWASKAGEAIDQPTVWVEYINGIGKARGYPDKMIDWDVAQVQAAWERVLANIKSQEEQV